MTGREPRDATDGVVSTPELEGPPMPASASATLASAPVPAFEYVGFHEDLSLPENEEGREWHVVFVVLAASQGEARHWGDEVCRSHASRTGDTFLRSDVPELHVCEAPVLVPGERHACLNFRLFPGVVAALVVVRAGVDVPDELIGW